MFAMSASSAGNLAWTGGFGDRADDAYLVESPKKQRVRRSRMTDVASEHRQAAMGVAFFVAILLLINGILLAVGTVLDMTPAVLIFTPIMLPVVEALGLHPVHFGVVMVLNLCIGLCTPPVGSVLFLGCSVSGTRITEISRALIPLYIAMIVALLTVTFVPGIALFLPRWFGLLD
jgi:TRAP-type C4-dicarboxylate transport system permease large subunit